jgi:hypothetical protein
LVYIYKYKLNLLTALTRTNIIKYLSKFTIALIMASTYGLELRMYEQSFYVIKISHKLIVIRSWIDTLLIRDKQNKNKKHKILIVIKVGLKRVDLNFNKIAISHLCKRSSERLALQSLFRYCNFVKDVSFTILILLAKCSNV